MLARLFESLLRGEYTISGVRNADLRKTCFEQANLTHATLFGANLSWTRSGGADFTWATLEKADLTEAELGGATLAFAILAYSGSMFSQKTAYARVVDFGYWIVSLVIMVICQSLFLGMAG